ncbi:hypothetical protein GCM10018791_73290 [Streptomyces zaomyceticus]|nr:hypothetical protein GCM10018791_73290 [Streptomyces zaomyceticus]
MRPALSRDPFPGRSPAGPPVRPPAPRTGSPARERVLSRAGPEGSFFLVRLRTATSRTRGGALPALPPESCIPPRTGHTPLFASPARHPTVFDVAVFGSLFLTLFVIMDPPGITPIFLALTSGRPAKVQRRMAWQAVAVALGVITIFGILGQQILAYLHVSVPALMIAGGLLLLLIALDLLTGKTDEPKQTKDVNVALVPLGMPLLAGPGAIVSVILAVQNADGAAAQVSVWAAIVAMHVVLWLTMRYSLLIIRVIKDGGVVLVTRLAGMMLSAIAVQQIINGITQVIQNA